MTFIATTFTSVGAGNQMIVPDGAEVSVTSSGGTVVLKKCIDRDNWQVVSPPLTQTGGPGLYRQDCTSYPGVPVTATINVTEAG